jgi:hypothetical protein
MRFLLGLIALPQDEVLAFRIDGKVAIRLYSF